MVNHAMNKPLVLNAVISRLQGNLELLKAANMQAKENATDSESRAETKWDTGGLEASYLARGYARRFEDWSSNLKSSGNLIRRRHPQKVLDWDPWC